MVGRVPHVIGAAVACAGSTTDAAPAYSQRHLDATEIIAFAKRRTRHRFADDVWHPDSSFEFASGPLAFSIDLVNPVATFPSPRSHA